MRLNLVFLTVALAACGTNKPQVSGTTGVAPPPVHRQVVQNPDAGHGSIVPGEFVGPLRSDSTRADLATRLGEGALKDQDVDIGEGQVQAGTVIHAGTDHELRAVWQTSERDALAWVHVIGTAWELPGGLSPGATLVQAETALGTFTFNGFIGDDSGFVDLEGTRLAGHAAKTTLRMVADSNAASCQSAALQVQHLSSDAPAVQACAPSLGDVIVRL